MIKEKTSSNPNLRLKFHLKRREDLLSVDFLVCLFSLNSFEKMKKWIALYFDYESLFYGSPHAHDNVYGHLWLKRRNLTTWPTRSLALVPASVLSIPGLVVITRSLEIRQILGFVLFCIIIGTELILLTLPSGLYLIEASLRAFLPFLKEMPNLSIERLSEVRRGKASFLIPG